MDRKELTAKSEELFGQFDEKAEANRLAAEGEPEAQRMILELRRMDQEQHNRVAELIQTLGRSQSTHDITNQIFRDKSPVVHLHDAPPNEHGFEHLGVRVEQDLNEGWPATPNQGRRTNSRQNRIVYVAYGEGKEEVLQTFETYDRGNGWGTSPFHATGYDMAKQYEERGLFEQQSTFEAELTALEEIVADLQESQTAA